MILKKENVFPQVNKKSEKPEISRLLDITWKAKGFETFVDQEPLAWRENFFKFQNCVAYQNLSPEKQTQILKTLNENILLEAYYIETAGMSYAAKMNLLSETVEEKSYFSIMGAEEAQHMKALQPFFSPDFLTRDIPSFSHLIGNIISECDRKSCFLLIQVLLEGWGLFYYQSLAEQSASASITKIFHQILKDETRHHSAGVLFYQSISLDKPARDEMKTLLSEILTLVRMGPWNAAHSLIQAHNGLTDSQIRENLNQMQAVEETQTKLNKLHHILKKSLDPEMYSFCLQNRLFEPFSLDEMVKTLR